MLPPLFSSHPFRPNQLQTDGTTTPSASQQVFPPNHTQGNPTNLVPNSAKTQSQMGMVNPQAAMPFHNSNTHLGNGPMAMSNRPISAPMGAPNHPLSLQNGMPLLGPAGVVSHLSHFHGGFGPQNTNSIPMAPMNLIQSPSQFFPYNSGNPPQYSSQNGVFLNGQFCLQSPMHNINQFVQMPMSNYAHVNPCNMHLYSNQVSQALTPQNPTFFANPQFGLLQSTAVFQPNQDQHKLVSASMDANATGQTQNTTQRSQGGNSPLPHDFGSVPPQHTGKDFLPSDSTRSQGNLRKDGGTHNWNNNWKNSQNKNFTKNLRGDGSHGGFSKCQFQNVQNSEGKFKFHNKNGGKGYKTDGARTSTLANSPNQRRSLSLNYTEQEIKQWREERKKNFPSKCNIKKKLAETVTEPEVIDRDAKLRRQQLKEILAKQAELGCEVAEIPSSYLSDTEKHVRGKEVDNKAWAKKEKFQNKNNRRGRFKRNERFSKKHRVADHDSSILPNQDEQFPKKQKLGDNDSCTKPALNKKQPTLLQRLLSADIRRDKGRLMQVFRFMVMNSFFKNWPEKPLRFPLIIVKDTTASEGEVVEEKSPSPEKGFSEAYDNISTRETEYGDYRDDGGADDDNGDDEHNALAKAAVHFVSLKGSKGGGEAEEEEGEIID